MRPLREIVSKDPTQQPPKKQRDRNQYLGITREGVRTYEAHHLANEIAADDFNIFATTVFAMLNQRRKFDDIRKTRKRVRHIDVGTGPNLNSIIACLPYVDEVIAIDLTPENIERLKEAKDKSLDPYWDSWRDLGAILYDIGSPKTLLALDAYNPELYDNLRRWHILNDTQKTETRGAIYKHLRRPSSPDNPYSELNLESELKSKLNPLQRDILNGTRSLKRLEGTADILTKTFVGESITSNPVVAAHVETNTVQLAKDGALWISAHMAETDGYSGFFTKDELKSDPDKKLEELPATQGFLRRLITRLVDVDDRYSVLSTTNLPPHRQMSRPEPYGGAAIFVGRVNYRDSSGRIIYETGKDLIDTIKDDLRKIRVVTTNNREYILYCTTDELNSKIKQLRERFQPDSRRRSILDISVTDVYGNPLRNKS